MLWPIIGGVVALAAALFTWGLVRIRRNEARAVAALRALELATIPALADECGRVFAERLRTPLDLADPTGTAWAIDRAIRSGAARTAFARPDLEWAFVLPIGACLGELIRRHRRAAWHPEPDGAPRLVIGDDGGGAGSAGVTMTTSPFDKVIKHHRFGREGDLYAYVEVALRGPEALPGTPDLAAAER